MMRRTLLLDMQIKKKRKLKKRMRKNIQHKGTRSHQGKYKDNTQNFK